MQTRRAALLTIAGAAATPLFSQQHAGHAMQDAATPVLTSYKPVFFKKADYAVLTRLVDLILPRTDTPGAVDAQVPFHIDQQVAASSELQNEFTVGLQLMQGEAENAGAADFLLLSEAQQIAVLTGISEDPASLQGHFFATMKGLTVDWYYRSEEGLVKELGFNGNTFRPDFPGCTHPEHWPETK